MRRFLALVELFGFAVSFLAVLGTQPRRTLQDWSESTIYPSWILGLVVVGATAALVSAIAPARATRVLGFAAGVSASVAGPVAGLGAWAVRHWVPAFGISGGFAGDPEILRGLAFLVAGAGTLCAVAAVAQLAHQRDLPRVEGGRRILVATGVVVAVASPLALVLAGPSLRDLTSIGAVGLVYTATWTVALVAGGWLSGAARAGSLAGCCLTALASCTAPPTYLTGNEGQFAFGAFALLFVVLLLRDRVAAVVAPRQSTPPASV